MRNAYQRLSFEYKTAPIEVIVDPGVTVPQVTDALRFSRYSQVFQRFTDQHKCHTCLHAPCILLQFVLPEYWIPSQHHFGIVFCRTSVSSEGPYEGICMMPRTSPATFINTDIANYLSAYTPRLPRSLLSGPLHTSNLERHLTSTTCQRVHLSAVPVTPSTIAQQFDIVDDVLQVHLSINDMVSGTDLDPSAGVPRLAKTSLYETVERVECYIPLQSRRHRELNGFLALCRARRDKLEQERRTKVYCLRLGELRSEFKVQND